MRAVVVPSNSWQWYQVRFCRQVVGDGGVANLYRGGVNRESGRKNGQRVFISVAKETRVERRGEGLEMGEKEGSVGEGKRGGSGSCSLGLGEWGREKRSFKDETLTKASTYLS